MFFIYIDRKWQSLDPYIMQEFRAHELYYNPICQYREMC